MGARFGQQGIVIVISNGVLRSVYADDERTQVQVVDWDDIDAGDNEEIGERDPDEWFEELTYGMVEIW